MLAYHTIPYHPYLQSEMPPSHTITEKKVQRNVKHFVEWYGVEFYVFLWCGTGKVGCLISLPFTM